MRKKTSKYFLLIFIFLGLSAAGAWYWFYGCGLEADLAKRFECYLQRGQREKAVVLVLENKFEFHNIFHGLTKEGFEYRYRQRLDSAEAAMETAREIAEIYQEKFSDGFLEREWEFCNGLEGERLRKKIELDSMYYLAYNHQRNLEYPAALSIYDKSLQLSREIGDARREVDHLLQIQTILYKQDFNKEALQIALQAQKIAHQIGYRYREEWLLYNIGNAQIDLGEYRNALTTLDTGLKIAEQLGDQDCQMRMYWRMGIPLWRLGEYPDALAAFNKALELCRSLDNKVEESTIYFNRGNVYTSLGNYTKAGQDYKEAMRLARMLNEKNEFEAQALVNLGELYRILGIYEESSGVLQKASMMFKELNMFYESAAALKISGDVFRDQNYYEAALEKYQHAQETILEGERVGAKRSKLLHSEIFLSIGDVHKENERWQDALKAYNEGLSNFKKIEFPEGMVHALTRLGNVSRELKRYREAIRYLEEAQTAAAALKDPLLESNAYYAAGLVYCDQQSWVAAEETFGRAINTVENAWSKITGEERISYFATVQDMYDAMILLQYHQLNYRAAFDFSERSRARAFWAHLNKIKTSPDNINTIQPPHISDIQRSLSGDIQIIEYKITTYKLLIFVADENTLKITESPISRKELSDLIFQFRNAIGADNYEAFKNNMENNPELTYQYGLTLANDLYNLLVKPVESEISLEKNLYIVPDEALFYLPFAALVVSKNNSEYLIQKYPFCVTPSAAVLKYSLDHRKPEIPQDQMALFAVANPVHDLPYSEKEVREIAKMFTKVDTLVGSNVAEDKALNSLTADVNVIHLATHAIIDEKSPMYSYLVLGVESYLNPDTSLRRSSNNIFSEDDLLMAYEVFNLRLSQARLVCLSACKTAGGRLFRGEGVIGLTRAFMAAGASSVITTLWDIDDEYTAKLMAAFYEQWIENKLSKARALREAQLTIIKEMSQDNRFRYPYPHRWAAFTLTGDYL